MDRTRSLWGRNGERDAAETQPGWSLVRGSTTSAPGVEGCCVYVGTAGAGAGVGVVWSGAVVPWKSGAHETRPELTVLGPL